MKRRTSMFEIQFEFLTTQSVQMLNDTQLNFVLCVVWYATTKQNSTDEKEPNYNHCKYLCIWNFQRLPWNPSVIPTVFKANEQRHFIRIFYGPINVVGCCLALYDFYRNMPFAGHSAHNACNAAPSWVASGSKWQSSPKSLIKSIKFRHIHRFAFNCSIWNRIWRLCIVVLRVDLGCWPDS